MTKRKFNKPFQVSVAARRHLKGNVGEKLHPVILSNCSLYLNLARKACKIHPKGRDAPAPAGANGVDHVRRAITQWVIRPTST